MQNPAIQLPHHASWPLVPQIKAICQPLFELFSIHYFDYGRTYEDGRVLILYSDGEYVDYFLKNQAYHEMPPSLLPKEGFHFWSSYIDANFLEQIKSSVFHYTHGITFIQQSSNYREIFNVATIPQNSAILNTYINEKAILQQFFEYFKDKASRMIQTLDDQPLFIADRQMPPISPPTPSKQAGEALAAFLKKQAQLTIEVNGIAVPINPREAQSLYLLQTGKTAKEIARILTISHRTVEIYLNNLRQKTASKNRIELLSKLNPEKIKAFESMIET